MRKSAIIGIALAITAFISGTIIAAGHKTPKLKATSIDPAAITQNAGVLPVVQVDEPF